MAFGCTRWSIALSVGTLFAALGCSDSMGVPPSGPAERAAGRLHLPLVTPDEGAFRLAQAVFEIEDRSGTLVETLSSDANPESTSLDAELAQAVYSIELRDGWALESLAEDGTSSVVSAALLTSNPVEFEIQNDQVTNILYEFATNHGVISFGVGGISIGVHVTTQAGQPSCDLLDRSSCPEGQSCLLRDGTSATFCADSGSLPVGAPCSSDQCVAGAQCLAIEGSTERVCTRFCNPSSSFCGCRSSSFDSEVGVCSSAAAGVLFEHDFGADSSSGSGSLACEEWVDFRSQLSGGTFGRVAINGTVGGSVECTDPAIATQLCAALANRSFANVFCQGHTWTVDVCDFEPEISVDVSSCNCSFNATVRPCDFSFGGFGTNSCSREAQVLSVVCE